MYINRNKDLNLSETELKITEAAKYIFKEYERKTQECKKLPMQPE